MANQIKSHPDGNIYITNGLKRYLDTSTNFTADMQTLNKPNPIAERNGFWQYNTVTADGGNYAAIQENGMHMPNVEERWANAEGAIAIIDDLLELQNQRLNAQSQPQE